MSTQIGDAGRIAGVCYGEGERIFEPIVPDAVGIVGGGRQRILLRAKQAGELKGDAKGFSRGDGAEAEAFEFGIRAVDLKADPGANHDADDRLVDRSMEFHRDADGGRLSRLQDDGGLPVVAERFEGEDFGAPIAAAQGREQTGRNRLAPRALTGGDVVLILRQDFAMVAAGVEAAAVDPPDLVGQRGDELRLVRSEEDGGAVAAETFQAEGGAGADQGIATGQGMVQRQGGDGRQVERVGWPLVARGRRGLDVSRVGPFQAGGEPEEFALPVAIFADHGNDRAIGGGGGKLVERREGGFAELNGHWD